MEAVAQHQAKMLHILQLTVIYLSRHEPATHLKGGTHLQAVQQK